MIRSVKKLKKRVLRSELGRWVCFSLAALLLGGCARFKPEALGPARAAEQLEGRSLTNAALKSFLATNLHRELADWPGQPWDLEMLTLAAFYYHPSLEVARAQWAVAQGGQTTAAQRPNPSLNVTPGYDTTTSFPSPWIPLTWLDIPIETAGKRSYRRAQAGHLAEAARLNIAATAWQVRSTLRLSLLDLAAATQRQGLLKGQAELQQQALKLLEEQVQAGALASSEVVPFRVALAKIALDLAEAQRLRAEARTRVAEAVGVPVAALDEVRMAYGLSNSVAAAAELSSAEVRRTALQSRADLLGALAEYAASQSALQLEIAKQYPDLHLAPGYQYDQGDNKWTLGLTLDLPVLNQNQGPIAEARARRQEMAARFTALQAKVLAEVERASQVFQVTEQNAANLRALAEAQARRRDTVAAQLRAGAAEPLDLVNARLESAAAELVQLDGQIKLQQAYAALEDAVQRPFQMPASVFEGNRPRAGK